VSDVYPVPHHGDRQPPHHGTADVQDDVVQRCHAVQPRELRQFHADRHDHPVAIVNHGPTRGDELATIRLDDDLTTVLSTVRDDLVGPREVDVA